MQKTMRFTIIAGVIFAIIMMIFGSCTKPPIKEIAPTIKATSILNSLDSIARIRPIRVGCWQLYYHDNQRPKWGMSWTDNDGNICRAYDCQQGGVACILRAYYVGVSKPPMSSEDTSAFKGLSFEPVNGYSVAYIIAIPGQYTLLFQVNDNNRMSLSGEYVPVHQMGIMWDNSNVEILKDVALRSNTYDLDDGHTYKTLHITMDDLDSTIYHLK